jgi:hypothetical protein
MPNGKMSGQIFISYRRDESRWIARSLCDRLALHFDRNQIFMDVDGIRLGDDFLKAIERRVAECDVLIAIIGAHWLTSTDRQGGKRLENPKDFVRMEIGTALKRDIRVIPVLVDGVSMPQSGDLPDDLKDLTYRNALEIGETHFDDDCRRLREAIEEVLREKATEDRAREEKERLGAQRKQKDEQDRLDSEREQGKRIAAEIPARQEKERLEHESRMQPPAVAPSTPSDRSKAQEAPGETLKVYPLAPKPVEPDEGLPSSGAAGKSPLKQFIAFSAIAAFIVVCGVLVYLDIKEPHRQPPQPKQVGAPVHQTTPFAAEAASVPLISATPTKEEPARTALDAAAKDHPWVNSLGMKFVPVAETQVLFSIWDTRVQDFMKFVHRTGYNSGLSWNVSWVSQGGRTTPRQTRAGKMRRHSAIG